MSPASGNPGLKGHIDSDEDYVSIQLMSPASGNPSSCLLDRLKGKVSIQLMSPASGNLREAAAYIEGITIEFPFN